MRLKYKFDGYDYDYETDIDWEITRDLFSKEFGINKTTAKNIISEFHLWTELEERYEEEITKHYEDEAREQFEEDREYDKDPEDYYGVSRRYD